jgi:hypothetical protein
MPGSSPGMTGKEANPICSGHALGTAIPLPQGVSPPVTEVGLPRLTALLISLEDPVGFSGRPRGRPSKGRAGNQRDQCESSDERLHDTSPLVTELTSPLDIFARLPISLAPNCCKTVAAASIVVPSEFAQRTIPMKCTAKSSYVFDGPKPKYEWGN